MGQDRMLIPPLPRVTAVVPAPRHHRARINREMVIARPDGFGGLCSSVLGLQSAGELNVLMGSRDPWHSCPKAQC